MVYSRCLVFICIFQVIFVNGQETKSRWYITPFLESFYRDIFSEKNIFYKPGTDEVVPLVANELNPITKLSKQKYGSLPCTCDEESCNCCVDIKMHNLQLREKDCIVLKPRAEDVYTGSGINMELISNNEHVFQNRLTFSAPSLCIPFPPLPVLATCVTLDSIMREGRNIKACVTFDLRITGSDDQLWALRFGCVKFGLSGISFFRPPRPHPTPATTMTPAPLYYYPVPSNVPEKTIFPKETQFISHPQNSIPVILEIPYTHGR